MPFLGKKKSKKNLSKASACSPRSGGAGRSGRNRPWDEKKISRKKVVFLSVLTLAFFFVLGFFHRNYLNQKGQVAGEEAENVSSVLDDELKKKLGSDVDFSISKKTGFLTYISAKEKKIPLPFEKPMSVDPTVSAKYFMQEYGKYFGLRKPIKELQFIEKKVDNRKMNHIGYVQVYKGIPVFGAQAFVHLKEDNSISSASARFVPNIISETKPKISPDRALREGEKYWEDWGHEGKPKKAKPKLLIFNKSLVENTKIGSNSLVWLVELWNEEKGGHEYFFINARDGSFTYHLSGTREITRNIFDGDTGSYVLSRTEGQGTTGVAETDNAYDYLLGAHDYFQNNFGRNGANDLGGLGDGYTNSEAVTDAYVRVDNNPSKPFSCPNAWYDYYSLKFCIGTLSSDILGHEYSHGVTYYSVLYSGWPWGFDYQGESGALDEGYADIFGELIESSLVGSPDWLMGKNSSLGTVRNLEDPESLDFGLGPQPAKMSDSGFYCGEDDYGGVHQNSTVLSHGAQLAAMGGIYNGYTVSGIGTEAMGKVFYRAMTYYLGVSSAFEDAYNALNSSCADLYGMGSANCVEFQKALQAVELDQASSCETVENSELIISDTLTLPYSVSKKAKARINLTVDGISVRKKKHVKVRLNGKKAKVMRIAPSENNTVVNIMIKYKKWPPGEYSAVVTYKQKIGKSWQRGSVSQDSVLSII